MAADYFKKMKEAPYPVFISPKPYSFDLNEDMVKLIRDEFNAEVVARKLAEAIKGKAKNEVEKVASALFEELGESWMRRTMQLGEEYSDRTIEMIMESLDRQGDQFLAWPHVPQRFVEIAYLSTQNFLKVPITLNNVEVLEYRIPQCALFSQIKEKCGDDVANLMTCKNYCLKALETMHRDLELDALIDMPKSTAKDGYCEFSMKKI
jgi:hypothetical protein